MRWREIWSILLLIQLGSVQGIIAQITTQVPDHCSDINRDGEVSFDDFFTLADDFQKETSCGDFFGLIDTLVITDTLRIERVDTLKIIINSPDCLTVDEDSTLKICPLENIEDIDVEIGLTFPLEGDTLSGKEIRVQGTVTNLPPGWTIRVLVNPPGDRWFPQFAPTIRSNGQWVGTIFVGEDEDLGTGKEFFIGGVILPEKEAKKLDSDISGNATYRIMGQLHSDVLVYR